MEIRIFCDGGARGNPGPSASAFVVYDKNNNIIYKNSRYLGNRTNNFAEYTSLIMALEWLHNFVSKNIIKNIEITMDSELVVKQMNGVYKVKSQNIKPLAIRAKILEKQIGVNIKYQSVLRENNKMADKLVNESIDEKV